MRVKSMAINVNQFVGCKNQFHNYATWASSKQSHQWTPGGARGASVGGRGGTGQCVQYSISNNIGQSDWGLANGNVRA